MQQAELRLALSTKRTFLAQLDRVVHWADLLALTAPHAPEVLRRRPSFAVQTLLRAHPIHQ